MKKIQYKEKFKKEMVRLITEEGVPMSKVADDRGISIYLIKKWREIYGESFNSICSNRPQNTLTACRELDKIQTENEILRNALGIMARWKMDI